MRAKATAPLRSDSGREGKGRSSWTWDRALVQGLTRLAMDDSEASSDILVLTANVIMSSMVIVGGKERWHVGVFSLG